MAAESHAASKTILRLAVDGLPPHATERELKRRLGAVGLEACAVKLELNPLSGDASGRGELTFRNVRDRRALLEALHADPAAVLGGRLLGVTYDDTESQGRRG